MTIADAYKWLIEFYGGPEVGERVLSITFNYEYRMPETVGFRIADNVKSMSWWITRRAWEEPGILEREARKVLQKFDNCDLTSKAGDWRDGEKSEG